MSISRSFSLARAALAAAALLAGCGSSAGSAGSGNVAPGPRSPAARFGEPTLVLPALGYGFEPSVVADAFGNVYVTAHKSAAQMLISDDLDSPTLSRSMSWTRMSTDGGTTWQDIPGLSALNVEQHFLGIEGDYAFDDLGRLYHVDTFAVDITLTRWTPHGPGSVTLDYSRPAVLTVNPLDDRPWITAHDDGHVFYFGNEGALPLANPGTRGGSGFGAGNYWVHASYDGGQTFDQVGYPLKNTSMCRPASDSRSVPGVHYVYGFCAELPAPDGSVKLTSFVSEDDGVTFERYDVATWPVYIAYPGDPGLVVGPNGALYALYATLDDHWLLFHSTDHGRSWTQQDITPEPGRYVRPWLAIAPDGRLGVGTYHAPPGGDWLVYGAIWNPGEIPQLVPLDPQRSIEPAAAPTAGADYMGSAFSPDGRLHVVWDRAPLRPPPVLPNVVTTARLHDVWHARSE